MTVKALLVPAEPTEDDPARLVDIEPNLATLQKLVGGYIEAIGDDSWHCYLNEDGKQLGLANNGDANRLVRSLGFELAVWDNIVGPAVFLGPDGADEGDVPENVIQTAIDQGVLVDPELCDVTVQKAGEDPQPCGLEVPCPKHARSWRVSFDRIGRNRGIDPIVITRTGDDPDQIAKAVFEYAFPKVASSNVNVVVDLERRGGTIFCGFHVGGSFKLHPVEVEGES